MNFEMVGKITISKESEKFKPYSEVESSKGTGWVTKTLNFNAICGDNRHMLTIKAGTFKDGHGKVYTYGKPGQDDNGKYLKGEKIEIDWKDRLTSPKIAEVAENRKFIVDLEQQGRRGKLENAAKSYSEGKRDFTESELSEMGIANISEIATELEKSKKRRHEFISEWDFIDFIKKLIESDKYANKKFKITGVGDYQYSEKNKRVYESYIPNRIYLAPDSAEEISTASFKLLVDSSSLNDTLVESQGKYGVNGHVMEYDSMRKGNIPVPVTIVFFANDPKVKGLIKKFTVEDDKVIEIGVTADMINGAQRKEVSLEDLPEEVREDIEFGLYTLEDVQKDMGTGYGDRIREFRFNRLSRGFAKGSQDTIYKPEDMIIKSASEKEIDIFDDDDLI